MEKSEPGWVGKSCGQHGPYTFFRSFKYKKNGQCKSLSMGDFFFVRCSENEPLCIAELQLLWETQKSVGLKLTSSRLYFLPECTPDGRMEWHGEDEVLAVRDKVVLKAEDLVDWIVTDVDWAHGGQTIWQGEAVAASDGSQVELAAEAVDKDKSQVIIVSYNKYCRHKAMLKRLVSTGKKWWTCPEVKAMGLIIVPHRGMRMLFCRDEFEHPSLAENEQLCDHLAPKLKGRPRKKKTSTTTDVEQGEEGKEPGMVHMTRATVKKEKVLQPMRRTRRKSSELCMNRRKGESGESMEEAEFLEKLYKFMHDRSTPINRLPSVGFKQINLYEFFKTTQHYGGHESITTGRLWKRIYVELGGNPGCTSAATCTRRHYERYIQPYVAHINRSKTNNRARLQLKGSKKPKLSEEPQMPLPTVSPILGDIRPRKRVKKVREHLEDLKKLRAAQQQHDAEFHLIPLSDLSTVQPSSLPGHMLDTKVDRDANFNIEPKSLINAMGNASVTLSKLSASQLLRPDDLRHKLNSKYQNRAKTMTVKHFIDQEVTKDISSGATSTTETVVLSVSPSPPMMSRPSVIQHTQQKSVKAERRSPLRQTVQPSDLILRNIAHQPTTSVEQSSKGASTAVNPEQLNHLRPPFVFPGMPFFRPFMPYPPMFIPPRLPPLGHSPGKRRGPPRYPTGKVKDLTRHTVPPKAHQVPVIWPPRTTTVVLPTQEEPCDLSLPKKRKRDEDDVPRLNKETIGEPAVQTTGRNGFTKESHMAAYDFAIHEAHKNAMAAMQIPVSHHIPGVPGRERVPRGGEQQYMSPSKSVKMTPQPRGSITQGVIRNLLPTGNNNERKTKAEKRSRASEAQPELEGLPRFMHPGMTGFMAATRGMAPFPFMLGYRQPRFPAMMQTPAGFLPQTPFLRPHSPLLGATVPTSLGLRGGHETVLPRGVIVPGPFAFTAASLYRTPVPPVVYDKQSGT